MIISLALITIILESVNPRQLYHVPITHQGYLTIAYNDRIVGRIELVLFGQTVPKTVHNWVQFCNGFYSEQYNRTLSYKHSKIHKTEPGEFMVMGDVLGSVKSSVSVYGDTFEDENFELKHFKNCLTMNNRGKNSNGSQFMITLDKTDQLDGKNVVFGRLHTKKSYEFALFLSSNYNHTTERPIDDMRIAECQVWKIKNATISDDQQSWQKEQIKSEL